MRLSVIIPTHNRPEVLLKTLDALGHQTLADEQFEVLVVDDGSQEENRVPLRAYDATYNYRLLEKSQGGLASSRNHGADQAVGDILFFLDDDVVPEVQTLEEHLRAHDEQSDRVAVVGSLPFADEIMHDTFVWYMEQCGHYDLYKNPRKYPGGRPPLPPMNGNSSVSRDLFLEIGRYDEGFQEYGGEDLELGCRMAQAGIRFTYNPRAVGHHYHLKDFRDFCLDMERAGRALIRIYRKYPEIKVAKKIDIVEDRYADLPPKKKLVKLIMQLSFAFPWVLALPRGLIRLGERHYALRSVLFPLYRWVGHTHYAIGMQQALKASE